jgi:hypothetical protein
MKIEQSLFNFDPNKENIKRQIYSVQPIRNVHTETRQRSIAQDVRKNKRQAFAVEGVRGLIEEEQDALLFASTMAKFNYSIKHGYMNDIGVGLYTMLTQEQGLYDFQEIFDEEREAIAARIIVSRETLYKAAFGILVNNNGRAVHGAADIVKEGKKYIMPIITGKAPMPEAYGSVQKVGVDGKPIQAVIHGKPIDINKRMTGAKDALVIDIDYFFFPIKTKKNNLITKETFIHQVAGLTSFLKYGSKLHNKGKRGLINTTTARRIIMTAQAGFELRYFAPDIIKQQRNDRVNVVLRRRCVKDLYPSAYDKKTERYRFKDFSNAVSMAGQYFHTAMSETGLKEEILRIDKFVKKEEDKLSNKLLIPARDKGAEFPKNKNEVYIKADKIK